MTMQLKLCKVLNKQWENLRLLYDLLKKSVKTLKALIDGYKYIGK